jgi:WD40 repeat protein
MTGLTQPPRVSQGERDRVVPECPYVGPVSFGESDTPYFFGRQRDCEVVVANLTTSRLTLFYAESGVGKSSVLRAGVLPRLREIARESYEDLKAPDAAVAYIKEWYSDPLVTIATAVLDALKAERVPGASPVAIPGPARLSVPWLREVIEHSRVAAIYLILDQFEEYFRYHPADLGEHGLTGELGRILSNRDLPVNVLLSIREDALATLDRFKGRVPRLYDNYLRLPRLGRDAAREAIKCPLDHYNQVAPPGSAMEVQPELIDTLLEEVRTGNVNMVDEGAASGRVSPGREDIEALFLQLVLIRLWEKERASGSSVLRCSTLDELGGAKKIVETHLRSVMDELSPEQQDVAAKIFRYLVTPTGAKAAQTAEVLAEWSGVPVPSVRELLRLLSSGRQSILRPVPPPPGMAGSSPYEIFHDVMGSAVLEWRRNHVAQQQQAEAARRLKAEREEASRRLSAEREEASRRLAAEREKREAARAAAENARRRLRLSRITMSLIVTLLLVIGIVAYQSHRNAQQQTALARAATVLSHDPAQSLEYAVNAYGFNPYKINVPWLPNADSQARSAVLIAASSPRSLVVAGPKPMMIGMKSTPDSRRIVAYDAHGAIRVIADDGAVREATARGLRGALSPLARVVAVNPDASRVALGTDQGTVAVIDTTTGRHIDIDIGGGLPRAVEWIGPAVNGIVLAVSDSGVTTTHNAETGEQFTRFQDIYDAVPLADQQHIVTCGWDQKLRVWDARTGTEIAESARLDPPANELKRYTQSVVSLSVVGLSVGAKPSIVVWNWQAGPNPVRYPVDDFRGSQQVVVNERAQSAIIPLDKEVRTYRLLDGQKLGSLPQQADFITDVATSPDGQWITTADANGRILVWSVRNQQSPTAPTYELLAHRGEVTQLSYLHDGQTVISLGADGTVRRWDLPPVPRFEGHHSWVVDMDLSGEGAWLATASQDGDAFILDSRNLLKPPVATVHVGAPLRAVLFDPRDPHRVFTLGRSVRVPLLWSWGEDGKPAQAGQSYEIPPLPTLGYLVSLAISPDGKTVAGGDNQGTIHLWDTTTGKLRKDPRFPGTGAPAHSIAFDPTGQLLAATDPDGIRLWRLDTADPPSSLRHPHATNVIFAPSGQHLASTAGDGTVRIWTRDGQPDGELAAHDRLSSSPSFSEDGELLAVGTAGGWVEIWDAHSGVTIRLDRHHSAAVNSVAFLPGDASRLVSASDDTTVAQFSCRACTDPDGVIRDAVHSVETSRALSR